MHTKRDSREQSRCLSITVWVFCYDLYSFHVFTILVLIVIGIDSVGLACSLCLRKPLLKSLLPDDFEYLVDGEHEAEAKYDGTSDDVRDAMRYD